MQKLQFVIRNGDVLSLASHSKSHRWILYKTFYLLHIKFLEKYQSNKVLAKFFWRYDRLGEFCQNNKENSPKTGKFCSKLQIVMFHSISLLLPTSRFSAKNNHHCSKQNIANGIAINALEFWSHLMWWCQKRNINKKPAQTTIVMHYIIFHFNCSFNASMRGKEGTEMRNAKEIEEHNCLK